MKAEAPVNIVTIQACYVITSSTKILDTSVFHLLALEVVQVGGGDWQAEVNHRRVVRHLTGVAMEMIAAAVIVVGLHGEVHTLLAVRARHQEAGDRLAGQEGVRLCDLEQYFF